MSLSVNGKFGWTKTQLSKDGSIIINVSDGDGPFKYRIFDYLTGQFTAWEENDGKFHNLECGYYHFEILDANGVLHPYPMGEIKPRFVVEQDKNDGAEYVVDTKDQVYQFKALEINEELPKSGGENFASLNKLDIMLSNSVYYDENFRYPYNDSGCYYDYLELPNIIFDDWRIPTYEDYMHILNAIPDISTDNAIRQWFEKTLNFTYEGFVEKGYEDNGNYINDRLSFNNIYSQYWVDHYVFKNRFAMSLVSLEFNNASSMQMLCKPAFDDKTNPLTMHQARLVRPTGDQTLTKMTFLEGWNYVKFPKDYQGTPEEFFGLHHDSVYFIKTHDENMPVQVYWPNYNINSLNASGDDNELDGKMTSDRTYAVRCNKNFRINLD